MAEVTIYGASDDLVELDGDFYEEISAYNSTTLLAFGDGTLLEVKYALEGVWRIRRVYEGTAEYENDEDPGNDENRYSDKVTLRGDLRWCLASLVDDDGSADAVLFKERKRAA